MKKAQTKSSSETRKKLTSKEQNISQSSINKTQSSKKEVKSQKGTSSSKNASFSKSNIQSGYSSISKERKHRREKIEEIPDTVSTGKKTGNKSPDGSQNLQRRRNALKSPEDISSVKKSGKTFKREDEIKVESINSKTGSKRGRAKQIEEEEKIEKSKSKKTKRINTLNDGDNKKVEEALDKIKTHSKKGKKDIDIKEESTPSESSEDQVISLEHSSKKRILGRSKKREEKHSKEKMIKSKNIKEESSQQSKHIVKKTPYKQTSEEISQSDESEKKSKASREKKVLEKTIKQQLTSNVDTSQISDEISRIIKRIEEKRKRAGGNEKKRSVQRSAKSKNITSGMRDKASTADLYDGNLQINKDIKVDHVVDIMEISKSEFIQKTDVLLSIVEIALNSTYYSLSTFNRSKSFWEDVMKYKELKKIFDPLKPETLKKYWININSSCGDPIQIADFIKKYKNTFEVNKIMVLPMISTAAAYLNKEITDLEKYIRGIPREPMRTDYKLTETIDSITGKVKTEKKKTMTTFKRARYGDPITRKFVGKNFSKNVDEIFEGGNNLEDENANFQNMMKKIDVDEEHKNDYLLDLKEEERRGLFSINDEDKFIFKTIEDVARKLNRFFPNYSDAFILESLKGNSFNILLTYKYLKDPKSNANQIFTEVDDEVIRNMRSSDYYTKLIDDKGKNHVHMRLDYLNV